MATTVDFKNQLGDKIIEIQAEAFKGLEEGQTLTAEYQDFIPFRDGSVFVNFKIGDNGRVRSIMEKDYIEMLREQPKVRLVFNGIVTASSGREYPRLSPLMR